MSSLTYNVNNNNSSCSTIGYGDSSSSSTYNVAQYISNNTTNQLNSTQIYQQSRTMYTPQSSTFYSHGGRIEISIYGR
jgi:hypothetical protein